ncbi:MAG: uridine kinase family protein [Acidimicrobiia bacterium]
MTASSAELSLEDFAAQLLQGRPYVLIAVDGQGGSGKSTLAEHLVHAAGAGCVISMDEFYRPSADRDALRAQEPIPPAPFFDSERLREQVLEPLRRGAAATWQTYDWDADCLGPARTTTPQGLLVIEGVSAFRQGLAGFYDASIWVECSYNLRLARGVARDGEAARDTWVHEWIPEEDRYRLAEQPDARAAYVVDGAGDALTRASVRVLRQPARDEGTEIGHTRNE